MKRKFLFFLNFFWVISAIIFILGLRIALPKIYLSNHVDEFQIGEMKVKSQKCNRVKHASRSTCYLKTEVGKIEKTLVFNDQPRIKRNDYIEEVTYKFWYHEDFNRAFFITNQNSEKLVLPEKYIDDIYSAIWMLIVPFLLLSVIRFSFKWKCISFTDGHLLELKKETNWEVRF